MVEVPVAYMSKTHSGIGPFISAILFGIGAVLLWGIVVHQHFMLLPVAFTGGEYHGSCIFKHGNEVGDYYGLCKKVFNGAEKMGALPLPFLFSHVIEFSVARPNAQMTALKSVLNLVWKTHRCYPWISFKKSFLGIETQGVGFLFPHGYGNEILNRVAVGINHELP